MAPKASGPLKRLGGRSIRTRILMIGWVPSLSLLLVGVVLASLLAYNAWDLRSINNVIKESLGSSQIMYPEVRRELQYSAAYLADPSDANRQRLQEQSPKTDAAMGEIAEDAAAMQEITIPELNPIYARQAEFGAAMPQTRASILDGDATVLQASEYWGSMIVLTADTMRVLARLAPNGESSAEEVISSDLADNVASMARGNGLAYVAFSNEGLSRDEYQTFVRTGGAYRAELKALSASLQPSEQQQLKTIMESQAWKIQGQVEQAVLNAAELTRKERQTLSSTGSSTDGTETSDGSEAGDGDGEAASGVSAEQAKLLGGLSDELPTKDQLANGKAKAQLPVTLQEWEAANDEVIQALTDMAMLHLDYSSTLAVDAAERDVNYAVYGGAAAVLFGIIIFLLTTRESNRLAGRLRGLRDETLDLAQNRLPTLVQGLRAGEVDEEHRTMPKLSYGADEIGEVADAFNQAQSVAVSAAVQEAETRAGLREVFLNIAYRSQVIVHRQLGVLEKAERFEEDPEQIELLFELDHLATRARRNAENLVILGGGQPGRRWRNSVELLQVVRSSISEAQDYARVSIGRLPRLSINGGAVADVIHLLAELVDNATSFSPPMSKVEVRGNLVGKGLVLEIEDQGLGIPADKLEELNKMLNEAPDFHALTLREEPRLGMFVVAQLAAGQNIRVTLTPSPAYGGTKAVVLIPAELFDAGAGSIGGGTQTLAIDGADEKAAAMEAGQSARSLHERMAITGEMTGEIAVIPPQSETPPQRPARPGAPALSVAPSEPRISSTPTGSVERIGGRRGEAQPTPLHPMAPVPAGPTYPNGQNGQNGTSGPPPTGPMRHAQSSFPSGPARGGAERPGPSSQFRPEGGFGEPGPSVNHQARADYLASRGNGGGVQPGPNGPATGSLPVRAPGAAPAGLGKGAPTPPAGVRGNAQGPVARTAGRDGRPGLPKRTRQAHLSDRLKNTPMPSAPPTPDRAEAGPQGDPEVARNRMAAFQRGTQRGRTERPDA
ncbi:ATP-binding protein [Kineosporia babensis]|uniref:histidine kinase n=1 Tax=Kineosporia babensis TaxID=499548 RepID=A0A9X1SXU1_9ACTN|nr:nitrate- and nitrite sensing domain-containing protein [Kineosporia babensis]MCD5316331.1 nitrate- and nitrite sensing domain-containing protein [Kineosporia babensis]